MISEKIEKECLACHGYGTTRKGTTCTRCKGKGYTLGLDKIYTR